MPETKELTFGDQLTGRDFNPGGHEQVNRLKEIFAEAADIVADLERETELKDLIVTNALTQTLNAQMACVKAVTFKN